MWNILQRWLQIIYQPMDLVHPNNIFLIHTFLYVHLRLDEFILVQNLLADFSLYMILFLYHNLALSWCWASSVFACYSFCHITHRPWEITSYPCKHNIIQCATSWGRHPPVQVYKPTCLSSIILCCTWLWLISIVDYQVCKQFGFVCWEPV